MLNKNKHTVINGQAQVSISRRLYVSRSVTATYYIMQCKEKNLHALRLPINWKGGNFALHLSSWFSSERE